MIYFTTDTTRKRCRQINKVQDIAYSISDSLLDGDDTRKATNKLVKLRNYLNREIPDKKAKKEREDLLRTIARINNWCAQDLAENAYVSDRSGNYENTLHGICGICQPFMEEIRKLPEYREKKPSKPLEVANEPVPPLDVCPRCGSGNVSLTHPAYDGGAYASCAECHYAPQAETWAPTDVEAAKRWNKLERAKR
jgi:hypothetical protein